jgi:hypothetical protein
MDSVRQLELILQSVEWETRSYISATEEEEIVKNLLIVERTAELSVGTLLMLVFFFPSLSVK